MVIRLNLEKHLDQLSQIEKGKARGKRFTDYFLMKKLELGGGKINSDAGL